MTRSRLSMVVAAAGLVLVGLLAVALFSPSDDEPNDESTAKEDEDITPVKAETEMKNPLGYELDTPPIEFTPTPEESKPEPKDEPKPEPTPEPEAEGGVIEYTIKPGDMISKLAVKYGCKSTDIYKLNDGLDKDTASKIRVGQKVLIPTGKKGAVAVANAGTSNDVKGSSDYQPRRVVTAEAGDTAFSLAIEYYGARVMFRKIVDANPELPWKDRLSGGEQVVLPAHGTAPSSSTAEAEAPAATTVERDSLIPPKK